MEGTCRDYVLGYLTTPHVCSDRISRLHVLTFHTDNTIIDPMNTSPQIIYEKLSSGEPLTDIELKEGLKHFTQLATLLNKSGPVFSLATNEANRVIIQLERYADARKDEDERQDRLSAPYLNGYRTGLTWMYNYTPGGPFQYQHTHLDSPEDKARALATAEAHRRWMMGFKEGLADKRVTVELSFRADSTDSLFRGA